MKVYVDANPNFYAIVAEDNGICLSGKFESTLTNNEAEYEAVLRALENVKDLTEILSDSQLVVRQLNHEYAIKEERLRKRAMKVWELTRGKVKFIWIPREINKAGKVLG